MAKLSVIIAMHNAQEYIRTCLDSLLAQTLADIEIIVVDDGSTDDSAAILAQYAMASDAIRCFSQANAGAAAARNLALRYAEGEYVGYLDSDDFADPDMFEIMYEKAKDEDADVVECNLHHTWSDHEDVEQMERFYDPRELLCFGRFVVWNKIYRRSWLLAADAHFPEGYIYEDVAFVANLMPYVRSYAYVDAVPIHYVQRPSSVNNTTSLNTMHIIPVLRAVSNFYHRRGFAQDYAAELEYVYIRILLCSSLSRICRMGDAPSRRRALRENWNFRVQKYPSWRKNPVLCRQRTRRALYMKTVNALSYRLYAALLTGAYALRRRWP